MIPFSKFCNLSQSAFFGFSFFLCFFLNSSFAQPIRQKIIFDDGWKFHLGNSSDPLKDFKYGLTTIFSKAGQANGTCIDLNFNDNNWNKVQLPHDWVVGLPFDRNSEMSHGYKPIGGAYPQNSIGWYRKNFTISKTDSGQRFVLQFDGVYRDSRVWVNGQYIGNNLSGYIGFEYDITDYVNFGQKNVVVVRADASQFEGWFYEGAGIYRHVWLNQFKEVHAIAGKLFVHSEVKYPQSKVYSDVPVRNERLKPINCSVQFFIEDRNGRKIAASGEETLILGAGEVKSVHLKAEVKKAILWTLDNPYMYRLVTIIKSGGKLLDEVKTKFGIRTILADPDKGLFLNGISVKIKGVCCHQDHAGVGSALPNHLQYYRILLLKQMGVNAYRTSHNPPTPELLDACDSLGMLVLDETRLLNSSSEYLDQFERLVLRDRNHPCVFMYSIGNEEDKIQNKSMGKRVAQTILLKQQELDPTRTSTMAINAGNVFTGVNEVIPVRGFNYNLEGLDAYRKEHLAQPIMGTEVASTVTTRGFYTKDTISNYLPDHDITFPSWATTAEKWWQMADERSWFMGGFVWTGFDYRGEPTPLQWPNINSHFGIMDMCGFPKNNYYYYRAWWSGQDVLQVSPHWNWRAKEGNPVNVWVNSNADSVELFLNGKSLGKKTMIKNSHLEWDVPYQPGILKAIGWRNNRRIEAIVETTGEPYQVVLAADRQTVKANDPDAIVFNVSVIDKNGREVQDAGNTISFALLGDARILGVGNGDPSSHESDQYGKQADYKRNLFNGKCQVIIMTGTNPGVITLQASGKELIAAISAIKVE